MTRGGFQGLDACVHCGFCLQACPTFLATGDESDSPRGRIELMRALERGDLAATDPALSFHLDRCLGCRGCEPVCPSGVHYGQGLEAARAVIARSRGVPWIARAALWALTTRGVSDVVYWFARILRSVLPRSVAGFGRIRFAMGMLLATSPMRNAKVGMRNRIARADSAFPIPHSAFLFRGCVQQGLFRHVHEATERVLQVNGYHIKDPAGQGCCGALHAHAGLPEHTRELARKNVAAFGSGDEPIVVNSAGCGAMMKEYGHVLGPEGARFAARVRDVTELLDPPLPGAPVDLHVAYDPPCHLLHAQRIAAPPLQLFAAIPTLILVPLAGASECCGSAGLFSLVEPEMSRQVLAKKLDHLRAAAPQVVASGNPGCLMQIGAGLAAAGIRAAVRHPIELLDESYRAAGRYA